MKERLIEVRTGESVRHTFPVTINDPIAASDEETFKKKALEAAAHAQLVPDNELKDLSAHMHVSRSGPLEPHPDPLGVMAETPAGLNQFVRERANRLWDQAGRPEGRAEEFWHQAEHQHWRERAYALWEREGCPQGKADEHWYRILNFERS